MRLILVEPDNINLAWKAAKPYLISSLELTEEYTLDDVYNMLRNGSLRLWMFYNEQDDVANGAMVTEIVEHPQKRLLIVFLLGADDFEHNVLPLFESFMEYVRFKQCHAIECYGRFGLEKILEKIGFKKSYIVMRKDIEYI